MCFKNFCYLLKFSHLIEENLRYGEAAIARMLKRVRGTYGLVIMAINWPDQITAARSSNPLVIGLGKNENIIASDTSAISELTKNVIYMNDGEMAVLTKNNVELFNILEFKNLNISIRKKKLELNSQDVQKNGYPHFMLKEIFEQPKSITNSFRGRIAKKEGNVKLGGLENVKERLRNINRLVITGCGTAYLAGTIGKLMIEELSGIPCEAELASELRYRKTFLNK